MLILFIYPVLTLILAMAFLCLLPAYIFGRKSIRQALLAIEDGYSLRTRLIIYRILGLISVLSMAFFAFGAASLIYRTIIVGGYVNAFTSVCATILCAWVHIHTRRARQRNTKKVILSDRLSSLVSAIINSAGCICLFMGLVEPGLAILGVLIFVLRYMLSYISHKK